MGGKGSGGARRDSGRKPDSTKELQKATRALQDVTKYTRKGLNLIGLHVNELIQAELDTALDTDIPVKDSAPARRFLLKTFFDSVPAQERAGSIFEEVMEAWRNPLLIKAENINVNMAGARENTIIEVEGTIIG